MIGKALFQAAVIILAIFSVADFTEVSAAEQKVCCEKTTSGEFCQYTEASNCDPSAKSAATSCEQTSFCKLGCGYDDNEARCFKNTPRATCNSNEECTWYESAKCDVPQCELGCCVLGGEASFVTEARCKLEASKNENAEMIFDNTVTSELACINMARSGEKGACVFPDGTCSFTARGECSVEEFKAQEGATKVNPNVGFHKDILCSNNLLGTKCARQQYTGCLPDRDEVYWFDSCGNPENIYSSSKENSYNSGYLLSKEESCRLNGANDPNCGNCDYTQNTLCSSAGRDSKPKFGNFVCADLNCKDITREDTSPSSQAQKRHGESWCAFDALTGFGQDPVGSRQFRRLCIAGQELTEPCKDFREEICIQGIQGESPLTLGESVRLTPAQSNYVEAACRDNRWQSCSDQKNKKDCDNIAFRDCTWVEAGTKTGGMCIPFVPPGLKFWPEGAEEGSVPGADATQQCNKGNSECTIVYEKGGLSGGWDCVANCECKNKKWLDASNEMCIAQGDCGAYYNIEGKFTKEGLKEDHPANIDDKSVIAYNDLIHPKEGSKEYNGFSTFFKKSAVPLTLLAAQGAAASLQLFGLEGTMTAGLQSGWSLISSLSPKKTLVQESVKAFGTEAVHGINLATLQAGKFVVEKGIGKLTPELVEEGVKEGLFKAAGKGTYQLTEDGAKQYMNSLNIGQGFNIGKTSIPLDQMPMVPPQPSVFLTTILPIINFVLLAWTVYNLVDVLFADTKTETINVTCKPWVAPTGGRDCEKCGEDGKPCSEYRCKSLGQTCRLVNEGTSNEKCVDSNPNDVNSPVINLLKEAMDKSLKIEDTPNRGYIIKDKIKPFTPVTLGIKTNEPSQCKFALNASTRFDEMQNYFGDTLFDYNHTMVFTLPSELAEPEVLKLTNGGNYQIYTRCQDAAANKNERDYFIRFGIQPGPDLTPPTIELTSIENNGFVAANVNITPLTVYANEPSECRWSAVDTDFDNMQSSFACNKNSFKPASVYYGLYDCTTILSGLKANQINNFYFRCKDQPNEKDESKRNVNIESYKFTLRGTIPLKITSAGPQGEVFTNNPELVVQTAAGAESGKATCAFSKDTIENAVDFVETGSNVHRQPLLDLPSGNYNFNMFCIDKGGNLAESKVSFRVSVDLKAPVITKVYKSGTILHLETNEETTCEYSTKGDFVFGKGTLMTGEMTTEHEATLDSSLYFVRCKDVFGNEGSYKIYP
ncbi:MAG: hypothetical protein AABW87_03890 [Nanoarchaeota archaeon]